MHHSLFTSRQSKTKLTEEEARERAASISNVMYTLYVHLAKVQLIRFREYSYSKTNVSKFIFNYFTGRKYLRG